VVARRKERGRSTKRGRKENRSPFNREEKRQLLISLFWEKGERKGKGEGSCSSSSPWWLTKKKKLDGSNLLVRFSKRGRGKKERRDEPSFRPCLGKKWASRLPSPFRLARRKGEGEKKGGNGL